jgi:glucokinase
LQNQYLKFYQQIIKMKMKKYSVGTDIGGSHISSVLIDLENEELITGSLSNQKVDNKGSVEEILNCWKTALNKTLTGINTGELAGIGFAMPGPFDYVNGIGKFTHEVVKYENLFNVNITNVLKKIMVLPADFQMRYMNDATSFAVGEAWMGGAKNFSRVVAITLGTGFGSAFIDNGVPVLDGNNVPGQGCVWHLPYENGIADDYFSTRWYAKRYTEITGKILPGVKEIAEQALKEEKVKLIFEEFGTKLGEFLFPIMKKFEAQCLVIGGNITGAYNLWGQAFESVGKGSGIDIMQSKLGETAAMIGSARLLDEEYWTKVKLLLSKM